jgi:arginine decarboxylase
MSNVVDTVFVDLGIPKDLSLKYSLEALKKQLVPRKLFFTTGVGVHEDALVSFELALRDAGIATFNLVTVSSIYPSECEIVDKAKGVRELNPGQIVFCVMSKITTNEAEKTAYASIGVAIPNNSTMNGYLTEYHGYCNPEDDPGKYAEDMAAYMLETAFNAKVGRKFNITRKAAVERGKYTTVVAAAVFVM